MTPYAYNMVPKMGRPAVSTKDTMNPEALLGTLNYEHSLLQLHIHLLSYGQSPFKEQLVTSESDQTRWIIWHPL